MPTSDDPGRTLGCMSFDVEEFDIPLEYGREIDVPTQMRIGREGLERVLEVVSTRQVPCTFFTTVTFAREHAALMRTVAAWRSRAGAAHEIASHGMHHCPPSEVELRPSREALEDLLGVGVVGYRSPRMVRLRLDAVAAAGFGYDASENPIWLPGRYNRWSQPRSATVERTPSGDVVVIPASTSPVFRVPLFWLALKNFPRGLIRSTLRRALSADGCVNTYVHPWECAEIQSWGLPRLIAGRCGRAMIERLDWVLATLQAEVAKDGGWLGTYRDLAELVRARSIGQGRRGDSGRV